jgi:SAM-dependent methyltransferase
MSKLTRRQDAFGAEVLAFFEGRAATEIIERDDGDICLSGGPQQYFADARDWPVHERKAIRLARGRVLDIGCGAGRVALHLQARGHPVTAIDVSPLAIKVCKARGVTDARVMSITQIGKKLGAFDTLIMYGNNFGLFGSAARAARLLRRFAGMTGAHARIIAESLDPYRTSDPIHLAYHRLNRLRGRMPGQARIRVRYRDCATPYFDYLLVSPVEMRRIAAATGWKLTRVFASAAGPSYTAVLEKQP